MRPTMTAKLTFENLQLDEFLLEFNALTPLQHPGFHTQAKFLKSQLTRAWPVSIKHRADF